MTVFSLPARVVIFTPSSTGADGISTMTREVARAVQKRLNDRIREFAVWSLVGNADLWRERGCEEILYRSAQGNKIRLAAWVIHAACRYDAETIVIVLHLHLLPVVLPLLLRGARIVVFLNGIEVWRPLNQLETWMLRRAWRRIAISSYTAARFTRINPAFATSQIDVCHLGLGEPHVTPSYHRPRENFALIVARMAAEERYKGHDLLLELWPRLRSELPNVTLLIVGDGDDRLRLMEKANSLGLARHVTFLGRVSDETLADLYQRCALFVMPSPQEGFGLVFVEAMRSGAASIGGIGAAAEVIEHGVTGMVVDPRLPDQVYDAIAQLLHDAALRQRMGAAGAVRFARHFTADHFQRRLLSVLGLEGARE